MLSEWSPLWPNALQNPWHPAPTPQPGGLVQSPGRHSIQLECVLGCVLDHSFDQLRARVLRSELHTKTRRGVTRASKSKEIVSRSPSMAHSSPLRKGSSFRQIIHSAVSWLMMALAVIFGVVGTVAAFFGAAFLLDSSSALFVVAISVGFLITSGGAWIAARMMTRARPGIITLGVGGARMLYLALVIPAPTFPPPLRPPPAP